MKSRTRAGSGFPAGCHSRPLFLKSPRAPSSSCPRRSRATPAYEPLRRAVDALELRVPIRRLSSPARATKLAASRAKTERCLRRRLSRSAQSSQVALEGQVHQHARRRSGSPSRPVTGGHRRGTQRHSSQVLFAHRALATCSRRCTPRDRRIESLVSERRELAVDAGVRELQPERLPGLEKAGADRIFDRRGR